MQLLCASYWLSALNSGFPHHSSFLCPSPPFDGRPSLARSLFACPSSMSPDHESHGRNVLMVYAVSVVVWLDASCYIASNPTWLYVISICCLILALHVDNGHPSTLHPLVRRLRGWGYQICRWNRRLQVYVADVRCGCNRHRGVYPSRKQLGFMLSDFRVQGRGPYVFGSR